MVVSAAEGSGVGLGVVADSGVVGSGVGVGRGDEDAAVGPGDVVVVLAGPVVLDGPVEVVLVLGDTALDDTVLDDVAWDGFVDDDGAVGEVVDELLVVRPVDVVALVDEPVDSGCGVCGTLPGTPWVPHPASSSAAASAVITLLCRVLMSGRPLSGPCAVS